MRITNVKIKNAIKSEKVQRFDVLGYASIEIEYSFVINHLPFFNTGYKRLQIGFALPANGTDELGNVFTPYKICNSKVAEKICNSIQKKYLSLQNQFEDDIQISFSWENSDEEK